MVEVLITYKADLEAEDIVMQAGRMCVCLPSSEGSLVNIIICRSEELHSSLQYKKAMKISWR